jgi:hypothetical protein
MSNRKIDQLPRFSGDTTGVHVVINNASNTTTYTVTKEIFLDGNNTFHGNQTISGSLNVSGSASVDYIIFDSQSATPLVGYMLQANPVDKTLDLRMGDNNATLQIGQEMYFPPVVNKSGGNLNDGDLVMVNPSGIAQGNRISVVKAVTDGTYPADKIVGILTEDLAVNQEGFATWFGYVRNLNKTQVQPAGETWAEGDILYPNPAIPGRLTKVFPTPPNLRVTVATITAINGNNVTLLVNFHKRTALKRAHDVLDNSTTSSYGDLLMKSGSVWTNSKTLVGDYTISGSLFISGTTEFGGNLVPRDPSGSTLGTELRPFKGIYVSSGSINVASDVIDDPNTSISNTGGNLLVSAGGMRLLGSASFIAATGSFGYISGSMEQVGNYTQTGNYTMVGDKIITGSLTLSSGSALRINNGFYVDGNRQFNYGQWVSLQTQSGSANTAYAMKLETSTGTNVGMYVGNNGSGLPTRIYLQNTGLYNIQFSSQLHTTANEACDFSVWFAMTGSNMDNSNTDFTVEKISGGGYMVAALNLLTPISSGSYVELFWSKTTANGQLQAKGTQSSPARPATPSVIVTLTQIA